MDYLFVQKYLKARNSHDIAVVVAFFFAIVSKLQRSVKESGLFNERNAEQTL
jgi:hypothetical protein